MLKVLEGKNQFEVAFLKKSHKIDDTFVQPEVEDVSVVDLTEVIFKLTRLSKKTTLRQSRFHSFYEDLSSYNNHNSPWIIILILFLC